MLQQHTLFVVYDAEEYNRYPSIGILDPLAESKERETEGLYLSLDSEEPAWLRGVQQFRAFCMEKKVKKRKEGW